ncbi:MAG TPA: fasciclin domain-containing protein [Galbitalea sp.]|nr:fasciclin domain-containing protein [Galbitalea sp.]
MRVMKRNSIAAITLAAVAVFGLAACSSMATTATPKAKHTASAPAKANPAADLVGSGCAGYAKQVPNGAGSIVGMSQDPVAVAASNNPLLTTLVKAVSGKLNPKVNLVSTLDGSQFTVFAPVDSAFAKLPAATVTALEQPANAALLTSILTYHVVPGEILPANIDGTHTTVEGQDLTVTGSGNDIMVNGSSVICGGVHTANATVYLIDTVLSVPAKK